MCPKPPALCLSVAIACAPALAVEGRTAIPAVTPSPYQLQLGADTSADRDAGNPYRLESRFRPDSAVPAAHAASPALAKKPFAKEIESVARDSNLDPALVHAIIHVESRHRQDALSPKGAIGLMQVLPTTAQRYGVAAPARSAAENLKAGTRYLQDLMRMFDGKLDLVLAAYNAGEGAVMRYKAIPPYKETRGYVPAVLAKYEEWKLPDLKIESRIRSVVYLAGTRIDPQLASAFKRSAAETAGH